MAFGGVELTPALETLDDVIPPGVRAPGFVAEHALDDVRATPVASVPRQADLVAVGVVCACWSRHSNLLSDVQPTRLGKNDLPAGTVDDNGHVNEKTAGAAVSDGLNPPEQRIGP